VTLQFDVVLAGGQVVDGLGNPAQRLDVGIIGDAIVAIDNLAGVQTRRWIDAQHKVVTPGFIDVLAQSHFTLLVAPGAPSKILQGVTLEVEGEAWGVAPIEGWARAWVGHRLQSLGLELDWTDITEYQARLLRQGIGLNVALTVPAGQLRAAVADPLDPRPLAPLQLGRARQLLIGALEQGAVSLTFHLGQLPGCHYTFDEIVALCRVVAEHGALAAFHVRSESNDLLESIDEVIRVARITGVRAEILHLKVLGRENWGLMPLAIARIEQARSEGIEITANAYPYAAAALALQELLPFGDRCAPGVLRARLRDDPGFRDEIAEEFSRPHPLRWWDRIRLVEPEDERDRGLSIAEMAAARACTPGELALSLLVESDGWVHCHCEFVDPTMIFQVFAQPWTIVCSDGSARSPDEPRLCQGPVHPRDYGAFARVLRWLVREQRILGLVEAVRRMTSQSADRVGLSDRGRIQVGAHADLLVFSPGEVYDAATYDQPQRFARGMDHVFVNGVAVVANSELTGALPGQFVQRGTARLVAGG
jgi:N-acyl-D-amino-acid deacylase